MGKDGRAALSQGQSHFSRSEVPFPEAVLRCEPRSYLVISKQLLPEPQVSLGLESSET